MAPLRRYRRIAGPDPTAFAGNRVLSPERRQGPAWPGAAVSAPCRALVSGPSDSHYQRKCSANVMVAAQWNEFTTTPVQKGVEEGRAHRASDYPTSEPQSPLR